MSIARDASAGVAVWTFLAVATLAADIHVDAAADPAVADGSQAKPYASIATALGNRPAGAVVWVHAGIYRERLGPNGTEADPVVIRAWFDPAKGEAFRDEVILRPTKLVTGTWVSEGSGQWSVPLPAGAVSGSFSPGRLAVLRDDGFLQDARWPDSPKAFDNTRDHAAWSTAGSYDEAAKRITYTIPGLGAVAGTDGLVGARVRFAPGLMWSLSSASVSANSGTTLELSWSNPLPGDDPYLPREQDWLVLYHHRAFLNRSDEFYSDGTRLYVASGAKPTGEWEVGSGTVISLNDRAHVTLDGLVLEGGGIWSTATTRNITVRACTFRSISPGLGGGFGVTVTGANWLIEDCDFLRNHGNAVQLGALTNGLSDAVLRDLVFADNAGNLNSSLSASTPITRVAVTRVTSIGSGSHGVNFTSYDSDWSHLHAYGMGTLTSDLAGINAHNQPQRLLKTSVHHSWTHSPRTYHVPGGRWRGCAGIRTDSGGNRGVAGVDIHHNIVWSQGGQPFHDGISIFGLDGDQLGVGAAAIRVVNNTVLDSLAIVRQSAAPMTKDDAAGIEFVNNYARRYWGGTVDAPPSRIAGNWISDEQEGLPASMLSGNTVGADPQLGSAALSGAPIPQSGSPLLTGGASHALSGGDKTIGALHPSRPWIAGALVTARQVPHLSLTGRWTIDGQRQVVVGNLPVGRLLPLGSRLRLGSRVFASMTWSYDPEAHRGEAVFAVPADLVLGASVPAAIALGGSGASIDLTEAATGLDARVGTVVVDLAARTITVTGGGFSGAAERLRAVAVQGPVAGDLRDRAAFGMLQASPAWPGGDMVAWQGDRVVELDWELLGPGARRPLAAALPADHRFFGTAAMPQLYWRERAAGTRRGSAIADAWPSLGSSYVARRFVPESLGDAAEAATWTSVLGGSVSAVGGPIAIDATGLGGFPALRFTGAGWMSGAWNAPGPLAVYTVYRNVASPSETPAGGNWQNLVATGAPGDSDRLGLTVKHVDGKPTAQASPVMHGVRLDSLRMRTPLQFGNRDPAAAANPFFGWLGETILFEGVLPWELYHDVRTYLRVRYDIFPVGRLATGTGVIDPVTLQWNGSTLVAIGVTPDSAVFRLPDGSTPGVGDPVVVDFPGRPPLDGHVTTVTGGDRIRWTAHAQITAEGSTVTAYAVRSSASAAAASVNVVAVPGTATAADHGALSATILRWAPGESGTKAVTLTIAADGLNEGAESFSLVLSGAVGAALGSPASQTVTILDPGALAVIATPSSVDVPERGVATFTARLNAAPAGTVVVGISRVSGDADMRVLAGASLTFTAATWNVEQTVTLAADADADRVHGVAVFSATAPALATATLVTATEADDDAPPSSMAASQVVLSGPLPVPATGVAEVIVNDAPATLDRIAGTWTARLDLLPGANLVTVAFVAADGSRSTRTYTVQR